MRFKLSTLSGLVVLSVVFISVICSGAGSGDYQEFSYLAKSFLRGSLSFTEQPGSWHDTSLFQGKYFWPLGPFPALVLVPFVYLFGLFDIFFLQGYLQIFLILGTGYFCFCVARKLGFGDTDALWFSFAFLFASQFIGVAAIPYSWYFAHVVTVFLMWGSILEYFGKRRYWVIGLLFFGITLTRLTAGLGILFFILDLLLSPENKKVFSGGTLKKILQLVTPLFAAVLVLGIYNILRFGPGSFFEQGYSFQGLIPVLEKARSYGMFALRHLPGNLFYAFLSVPLPVFRDAVSHVLAFPFLKANAWGMSIFVTSPYLLTLFSSKGYRDRMGTIALLTSLVIALPLFLYYGIGYSQFGYRYALDFMPFIFLLLLKRYITGGVPAFSGIFRVAVALSALFNLYLLATIAL